MNKINPLPNQKIVLIGDSSVGKTSILGQLKEKVFKPTIEVKFFSKLSKIYVANNRN